MNKQGIICSESEHYKEGQTIIEFREELLSLIEEADGDNMLQIGASDPSLRKELDSI